MSLWIVSIGSSDVQLDSDKTSQEKGRTDKQRSDKIWNYWYDDELQAKHHDIQFEPKQLFKDKEESYRIAPRILGTVYQESAEPVQQEIWSYLTFPLLDNFVQWLKTAPEGIVVLLTDQSKIFSEYHQRRRAKSPYWQDTCELKPILKRYFESRFQGVPCEFISLIPKSAEDLESAKGLDNWDSVLTLVQEQFRGLTIAGEKIEAESHDLVYVSHQAGTPAISSAVQFTSLAKFGERVWFLVSNEYQPEQTDSVESSSYLRGIQIEQAKKLLERRDYAGVQKLLNLGNTSEEKRINHLLDAAIEWNFAEFQKFKNIIVKRKLLVITEFPWWQSGYEAAYLAWVRLKYQNDTVEALFHSFRGVEGTISKWAEKRYGSHIQNYPEKGLLLKLSITSVLPKYIDLLSPSQQESFGKWGNIGLYGSALYKLLQAAYPDWKSDAHIEVVWKVAADRRNELFHRIEGLQELEVYQAWNTENHKDWETRLLGCLNFIAQDDLPKKFTSLKSASLMNKVHQELKQAIEQL